MMDYPAPRILLEGGQISHLLNELEIHCLPKDLPEYLEVDMLEVELGQIVHLSEISLPEGVTSTALELGEDHDLAIASVIAPRGAKEEADGEVETTEDEGESAGDDASESDDTGSGGEG